MNKRLTLEEVIELAKTIIPEAKWSEKTKCLNYKRKTLIKGFSIFGGRCYRYGIFKEGRFGGPEYYDIDFVETPNFEKMIRNFKKWVNKKEN